MAEDPLLQHKAAFLNTPFFFARATAYFVIWIVVTQLVVRWSRQQDEGDAPRPNLTRRLQLLSGAGLPIYALTVSFATIAEINFAARSGRCGSWRTMPLPRSLNHCAPAPSVPA